MLWRRRVEQDVRPAAVEHGLGLVVWSPLASGVLTGKYDQGIPKGSRLQRMDWLRQEVLTESNRERVRAMQSIAERLGCSRAQLALAWAAAQPGVSSVITGATSVEQLRDNLGSLKVTITPEVSAELDRVFPGSQKLTCL